MTIPIDKPFGILPVDSPARPISPNCIIQPIGRFPGGGDIHDTFNINNNGGISNGHTTIRLPDRQEKRIDW